MARGILGLSHNPARREEQRNACKARRLAKMRDDPQDPLHGTRTGYGYGCRCDRCREAVKLVMRDYRAKRKWERANSVYVAAAAWAVLGDDGKTIMVAGSRDVADRAREKLADAVDVKKVPMITRRIR